MMDRENQKEKKESEKEKKDKEKQILPVTTLKAIQRVLDKLLILNRIAGMIKIEPRNRSKKFRRRRRSRGKIGLKPEPATVLRTVLNILHYVLGNFYGNEFHHPTDVNNVTTNGKMFHSCGNKNYIVWLSVNLPYIRISFCIELKNCSTAYLNNTHTKGCYKSVLNVIKFKRHLSY
ncbi:hypothetical protein V1477_016490 [Vespula maculifrons]|uniref:Uncharacterized protein n=1 Tax=Vespula maculifrons TaxID=7453 RepID=A0ABD2B9E1_VESMC